MTVSAIFDTALWAQVGYSAMRARGRRGRCAYRPAPRDPHPAPRTARACTALLSLQLRSDLLHTHVKGTPDYVQEIAIRKIR